MKQLVDFMMALGKYVNVPKEYVENVPRLHEVEQAYNIASELFNDMQIELKDDALGIGALALSIKGFDMVVKGSEDIKMFSELIKNADNFEIYALENGNIAFTIMFGHVYLIK